MHRIYEIRGIPKNLISHEEIERVGRINYLRNRIMKKFLLTAVVAVFALAANAQVWVGGSLGASTSKVTNDGHELYKKNAVKVAPTIGYTYNDDWDFALDLIYEHADGKGTNSNAFGFAPYARYKFVKAGAFKAFVEGGFSYENTHVSGFDKNVNDWEIFIRPGVSYDLSKKVTIDAKLGALNYQFEKQGDLKTNTFGLDLHSDVQFGVYYNF